MFDAYFIQQFPEALNIKNVTQEQIKYNIILLASMMY